MLQVECLIQPGKGRLRSLGNLDCTREEEARTALAWICKHQADIEKKMKATLKKDLSRDVGLLDDYLVHDRHFISAKQYDAIKEFG